ncbi:SH3 domain-containing protein [Allorhizobium sp. NPDC080224]|uniref:SH3 domain-containing protein n=1 Tax=Rhizobium rosettiformans TaxID=1368430 RepID=A0ABX7EQR5_9HYPH|nr:SH3 domain-containing protein [Rhizobium rosettiformans]QRF50231.1 SH3 domain-containing protein [Rhizobium rosettiformans]
MRRHRKEIRHRSRKTLIAVAVLLCVAPLFATPSAAQQPQVIPAPDLGGGGGLMTDTYLWHVRGLPPGQRLPVYSGAGPNFRIIHALDEGTPIERLSCRDSRGGYWCRVATVDRVRISGWVDGRFLLEEPGFAPPDDVRNPSFEPEILIDPFARPRRP